MHLVCVLLLIAGLVGAYSSASVSDSDNSLGSRLARRLCNDTEGKYEIKLCQYIAEFACEWAEVDKKDTTGNHFFGDYLSGKLLLHEDSYTAAAVAYGSLRTLVDLNVTVDLVVCLDMFKDIAQPNALTYDKRGIDNTPLTLLATGMYEVSHHVLDAVVKKLNNLSVSNTSSFPLVTYWLAVQTIYYGMDSHQTALKFWIDKNPTATISHIPLVKLVHVLETKRLSKSLLLESAPIWLNSRDDTSNRFKATILELLKLASTSTLNMALLTSVYQESMIALIQKAVADKPLESQNTSNMSMNSGLVYRGLN